MIKSKFLFGALIFTIFLAVQTSFSTAQDADLNLVLTKQTPYPVEPGQVVSIEVALQNNGTGAAKSLVLEVFPTAPFTLLPGQEKSKRFSRIGPLDSVSESYKLKVDENAVSATYDLEFRYYIEGSEIGVLQEVSISVQGIPKIVITDIQTTPASMQPGDEVEISVYLKNEGGGGASQTELSLASVTDADTGESIIVPVLSGGSSYLGKIGPGEEKTAKFKLRIENDAEYKTYMSTLTINYKDESGQSGSTTFDMGLPVKGKPLLDVLNTEIDRGDFKVELSNLGTARAKGVKISLVQAGKVSGVSVVSEIKAGKYKAIRFNEYGYGDSLLNISYYDESNQLHYTSTEVFVEKPGRAEGGGGDPTISVVLFIVVALEAFYIWRLRKKKK